jgi:hypothetical protein
MLARVVGGSQSVVEDSGRASSPAGKGIGAAHWGGYG